MVFLLPDQERKIRKGLTSFLKRRYSNSTIKSNHMVFHNFAPDYYITQKNSKKRIIIFRNPPEFPHMNTKEIQLAQKEGIGVYIATFNHESDSLLESLIEKCDEFGVGVIHCTSTHNFQILQPCLIDFPKIDKIIEKRIKFFISSKFWIQERDNIRKTLFRLKHQPICMERVSNQESLEQSCFNWIDESQFFIGIITTQYRPWVDKEIRHALRKKQKKCIIFVNKDCSQQKRGYLKQLVDHVKKKKVVCLFNCPKELGKLASDRIVELVAEHTK